MAEEIQRSWIRGRVEETLRRAFQHAYETVKVNPEQFLLQMRMTYGLPVTTFQGVYSVEIGGAKTYVADDAARLRVMEEHPNRQLAFARFKGLGEMDPPELRETCMDPASRHLVQLDLQEPGVRGGGGHGTGPLQPALAPGTRRWPAGTHRAVDSAGGTARSACGCLH